MHSLRSLKLIFFSLLFELLSGVELVSRTWYEDDLQMWNVGVPIYCGSLLMVGTLGAINSEEIGDILYKSFALPPSPSCVVTIEADILAIDSWENETISFSVNYEPVWEHTVLSNEGTRHICGSEEADRIFSISQNVTVSSEELRISLEVALDFGDNEGYGISRLAMFPMCEEVPTIAPEPTKAPLTEDEMPHFTPNTTPPRPSFAPTVRSAPHVSNNTNTILGPATDEATNIILMIMFFAGVVIICIASIVLHHYRRKWSTKQVYSFADEVEASRVRRQDEYDMTNVAVGDVGAEN